MNKLPQELIAKIISYTYSCQNKDLLEDVKSYVGLKQVVLADYYRMWIVEIRSPENQDKNWLANDISLFLNDYEASMNGYTKTYLAAFRRLFKLKNKSYEEIVHISFRLWDIEVNYIINFLWGLLTTEQRHQFIKERCQGI
jgi:hypothetical protein